MSNTPSYREDYFQYQTLTKIHGNPNYESLAKLEKEIKANGKSVPSTLGGGNQGHLGLVSSALAYERSAPGTPFVRPAFPPVLPDLTGLTGAVIAALRHTFTEDSKRFQTCVQIERSILQQITNAIDDSCLAHLLDENGSLDGRIPDILRDLFDTYGSITPQSLTVAKTKVERTVYDHARPIATIFTSINEYARMAEAADAAETPRQLINIALIIITGAAIFASDIRKWNEKPEVEQTWPNFIIHFKAAQKAIRQSQPTVTTDTLGYHGQANAVADQIAEQQMEQQIDNMANSVQQNQDLLTQMQALATTISGLQTQVNNQSQYRGRGNGDRGNGREGRGNGREGHGNRGTGRGNERTPQYCWTHGNCAHPSTGCNSRAAGHQESATYQNMQGGSTSRCHWL
jgi:hypothetical protein